MNNISSVVESQIKTISSQYLNMMSLAANNVKNYTSTNIQSLVTGAASSTTPVTVSTSLTQYQFESGITFFTQVGNFFGNASVTSADYLGICQNLITGTTPASSPLSSGTETLGLALVSLAQSVLNIYSTSVIINSAYNQNGLAQCVSAISSNQVVLGCNTTATQYTAGITMVLQFINLMTNQSVATGNYLNTATSWTNS